MTEQEAIAEVLAYLTVKIEEAEDLRRWTTFKRLMDERFMMIIHGIRAGMTPAEMVKICHTDMGIPA